MKIYLIKVFLCLIVLFGSKILSQDLSHKLDNYFSVMEQYGFSGAALVAKEGETIINKGYGYANREVGKKNTTQSIFSTGSLTKQFTAAAMMKLEMIGKLKASDKLAKYFDDVPEDKADITIHNMLTHTSGLPIALADDFARTSKHDFIEQAFSSQLLFKPGSEFQYSNVGYTLCAIIIEKISGFTYEQFLNTYLFMPAGMKHTGYSIPNWDERLFVNTYDNDKKTGSTELFTNPTWYLVGNGGILSTTDDMLRWIKALQGNEILSDNTKAKMFTPFKNDYAYGWDVLDNGGLRQHDGGSSLGLSTELRWYVDDNTVTILFTNSTIEGSLGFPVLRDDIEAIVFGHDVQLPPKLKIVDVDLTKYLGKYKLSSGSNFTINGNSNKISITVYNSELESLFALSSDDEVTRSINKKYQKAFKQILQVMDYDNIEFPGNSETLISEVKNEILLEGLSNPHFKIIKTSRLNSDSKKFVTKVALNDNPDFDGESMLLEILTGDDTYLGMGVDFGYAGPLKLTLHPLGDNKFQAYNLLERKGAVVEILHLEDKGITIQNNQQRITASKL